MNKYIRTKNRIYPVCQAEDRWKELGYRLVGSEIVLIPYNDIIKEADSIKDLIDEYVWDKLIIEFRDKTHFSYENDDFIFELDESILKEGIYGAIWNDKGLIYVAKMNEEGVLELL